MPKLANGTCRVVCRPNRTKKRGWSKQAILRVVTQHLEDGGNVEELCEELREVLQCNKCDCGRLPALIAVARETLDRILTPEVKEALLEFQDVLDSVGLPEPGPINLDDIEKAGETAGGIRKWIASWW